MLCSITSAFCEGQTMKNGWASSQIDLCALNLQRNWWRLGRTLGRTRLAMLSMDDIGCCGKREKRSAFSQHLWQQATKNAITKNSWEEFLYCSHVCSHISIRIATTVCNLYIYYGNPALMNVGAVDRLGCTSNGLNHNLLHHCWTATNMGGTIDTGRGNSWWQKARNKSYSFTIYARWQWQGDSLL